MRRDNVYCSSLDDDVPRSGRVDQTALQYPDSGLGRCEFIGNSPALLATLQVIQRLSRFDVPVLLHGETGTGKELAARTIHYSGVRRDRAFIPVNCGAIPDQLVESELFGHVRGAFTDAREAQLGLVAQAHGGTLFLDEVDSLSMKAQVTLLRFLQDGSYRPLGARQFERAQVRVIAATNADLEALVHSGAFRRDLFFRLAIAPVVLPPLRERHGDVRMLAEAFLHSFAEQQGGGPRRIDPESLHRLECYAWPGNVRELINLIQRSFLLAEGSCLVVPAEALGIAGEPQRADPDAHLSGSFRQARARVLAQFESSYLRRALTESSGNVSLAAKRAGKERRSFGRLLKKHGIDRDDFIRAE